MRAQANGSMHRRFSTCTFACYAVAACALFVLALNVIKPDTLYVPRDNSETTEILSQDDALRYQTGWTRQEDPGLLRYIRQRWLFGPSAENYNLKSSSNADVSQMSQSTFVDDHLGKRQSGFFVECGAANGETFSNTLFLERMRGWTGLLVEANPEYFSELLATRRNAYSINTCLSVKNESDRVMFRTAGLFGGVANKMDATHLRAIEGFNSRVLAQCFPLVSILRALGRSHVDYFSLDVEGPELDILRTIPFHEIFIDLISVEYRVSDNVNINETASMIKLNDIRGYFKATGLYDEVGIIPTGKHDNPTGDEKRGLDVFFRRRNV